jgi:hypothetical protein
VAVQLLDDRVHAVPPSTPGAVVTYLRALRPSIGRVTESRQQFIRRVGMLMERARQGDTEGFGDEATGAGREAAAVFRSVRLEQAVRPVPVACEGCHEAALTWIDMLIAAAEVLSEIGVHGDPTRLREVQVLLAEGRAFSNRFRAQYALLVQQLRAQAPARRTRRKIVRLVPLGRRGGAQ